MNAAINRPIRSIFAANKICILSCMYRAIVDAESKIASVLTKTHFWDVHQNTVINARQRSMINKLFDGFEGKLKSSKWAKISKCSADTALRDIKDLMNKGILTKENDGGRSTNYVLAISREEEKILE